jgi:hypothetical protein
MTIVEVFEILSLVNKYNTFEEGSEEYKINLPLRIVFEASTMLLKQLNPDAFEILLFLGFCPSGMLEEDLDVIWENGWTKNKSALIQ